MVHVPCHRCSRCGLCISLVFAAVELDAFVGFVVELHVEMLVPWLSVRRCGGPERWAWTVTEQVRLGARPNGQREMQFRSSGFFV